MRNSRRSAVDPFIVMDVMEAARAAEATGRDIVHMEVGQPGTGAPQEALDRLAVDMAAGPLGYTVALGLPDLRARIARHYGDWYDVDLDPARVIVTSGASGGFLLAFSALFDTGDRVGLGYPCYPSYRQILRALDIVPVGLPTTLESRLQPRASDVDSADLQGLIVASPGNPSGTVLTKDRLTELAAAMSARGGALISDEIYHGLSYGNPAPSALEVTDDVYVINSFSKYFSMTGWRVGWMVVPESHVRTVERLAQNMFICPPHASQRLALHAMDCGGELDANVAAYRASRALLLDALPGMGLKRTGPADGAFYIYADVSGFTRDSLDLSRRILDEAGVAVTPGLDFDPDHGHEWLRLSYAGPTDRIAEGAARLGRFFGGLA